MKESGTDQTQIRQGSKGKRALQKQALFQDHTDVHRRCFRSSSGPCCVLCNATRQIDNCGSSPDYWTPNMRHQISLRTECTYAARYVFQSIGKRWMRQSPAKARSVLHGDMLMTMQRPCMHAMHGITMHPMIILTTMVKVDRAD